MSPQTRPRCSRASPHRQRQADLARLRPDHRGGVREPRAQGPVTQEAEPQLAPGGFFASNTSTLPITGLATGQRAAGEVHRHPLLQPGGQDEAGGDHPRQADRRRDRGARLRLRAGAGQDAHRGQRLARLLHQPHLRHLRDGRRGHAGRRHSGAGDRKRRVQAGMPVGPLAVLDETALSLSVHVLDQTRADFRPKASSTCHAGRAAGRTHGQGAQPPGRAAGGGFYDYPGKGPEEAPVARAENAVREAGRWPGTCRT
jgi:3-hydroxyacyl-CoA dehydrogenase / enoyl-CoA hydratase / 3-hydroxybutyryl-CoA epimerase